MVTEADIRVERVRLVGDWNVRATHVATGWSAVVMATDDRVADRERAIAKLQALLDDIELVRTMVANGSSVDEAATVLVNERGRSPIPAIKALAYGLEVGFQDAKVVVHRNLSPSAQAAAERLWDAAEEALTLEHRTTPD